MSASAFSKSLCLGIAATTPHETIARYARREQFAHRVKPWAAAALLLLACAAVASS